MNLNMEFTTIYPLVSLVTQKRFIVSQSCPTSFFFYSRTFSVCGRWVPPLVASPVVPSPLSQSVVPPPLSAATPVTGRWATSTKPSAHVWRTTFPILGQKERGELYRVVEVGRDSSSVRDRRGSSSVSILLLRLAWWIHSEGIPRIN